SKFSENGMSVDSGTFTSTDLMLSFGMPSARLLVSRISKLKSTVPDERGWDENDTVVVCCGARLILKSTVSTTLPFRIRRTRVEVTVFVPLFCSRMLGVVTVPQALAEGVIMLFIPRLLATGSGSARVWLVRRLARLGLFSITVIIRLTWPTVNKFMHASLV